MNPLIKWPGGKSGEINKVTPFIPKYKRYIEPFFGGGAMFFFLNPHSASINDISASLIEYYRLIKKQDKALYNLLVCYNNSFTDLISVCKKNYTDIYHLYALFRDEKIDKCQLNYELSEFIDGITDNTDVEFCETLLLDKNKFLTQIKKMSSDKIQRTVKNNLKTAFSDDDLKNNLITGFTSGYYMYFREVYNDINLKRIPAPSIQYKAANFYFIREYCYGSMFRYNAKGEFNIPYGGMSYNKKNLKNKIDNMFNKDIKTIFKNTDICCMDFEEFLNTATITEDDFIFLDPPYDTDFSDYEGKEFTKNDHERLANSLKKIQAQFILIIKNTDFIYNLYKDNFSIFTFDNQYTYNVRSRNERNVEHLIVTNIPAKK